MANIVHPRGRLEDREGDINLLPRQYLKLSLFSGLKKPPDLDKFPGSLILRRYRRKDELFRQGEPGWTAFYILTLEDLLAMREMQMEMARRENERRFLQLEIDRLKRDLVVRQQLGEDDPSRQVATVHLATLGGKYAGRNLTRMTTFISRPFAPIKNAANKTVYIPVGGPQTISYDIGRIPLSEGDLFGEMSCLYRTPRSATVVADRDCYMIEFLRSILDKVQRDQAFKSKNEDLRRRIFDLQVRKNPMFRDLKDEEFAELREGMDLVSYEAGDLICDEHERSDCMYLVRQGLDKIMKNVSYLLSSPDITDWTVFGPALLKGATSPTTPQGKFWSLLPERSRNILQNAADPGRLGPAERSELLFSINDVLKDRKLSDNKEFKPIIDADVFKGQLSGLPTAKKEWNDLHYRQVNRLLLEALYPSGLRQYKKFAGVESILHYASPGEYIGEMGLLLNQPRSASCVAYGHPNQKGLIDLVKIPSKIFWRLMRMSEPIREKIKAEVGVRRKNMISKLAKPVWEEANQVQFSEQFSKLGLIQGQRLMLIDLDRCTRCDECVKACINTHTDNRSRLFLDGPRFGNYLVPTACRSCLDPVCMTRCPVASIHKGDNREIVIEPWCIGCEACAEDCPYGSIQMYDLGVIAEETRGWRFMPGLAEGIAPDWFKLGANDRKWLIGATPFLWDREMQTAVRDHTGPEHQTTPLGERPINFRFTFDVKDLRKQSVFKFEVLAMGGVEHLWLNGAELPLDDKVKRGRHEYSVPPRESGEPGNGPPALLQPATAFLRGGGNVIAVQVRPPAKGGDILLQLRLDEVKKIKNLPGEVEATVAEEVIEKIVQHRAVVCDLCSTIPGRKPACVHACPHDAAMRIDARSQFPAK